MRRKAYYNSLGGDTGGVVMPEKASGAGPGGAPITPAIGGGRASAPCR